MAARPRRLKAEAVVQLVVLSNRRDKYLPATLEAIRDQVYGWDELVIVDDSGDEDHRQRTAAQNPDATVIPVAPEPAGYAAAMAVVTACMHGDVVAFWEEDFIPVYPIDLESFAGILTARPHLAQLALLRQPWFGNEVEHGGVVEALEAQGQRFDLVDGILEHSVFFTGNPSLWTPAVYRPGWPTGAWSENQKRDQLRGSGYKFGLIPEVRVHHVGERSGFGY